MDEAFRRTREQRRIGETVSRQAYNLISDLRGRPATLRFPALRRFMCELASGAKARAHGACYLEFTVRVRGALLFCSSITCKYLRSSLGQPYKASVWISSATPALPFLCLLASRDFTLRTETRATTWLFLRIRLLCWALVSGLVLLVRCIILWISAWCLISTSFACFRCRLI